MTGTPVAYIIFNRPQHTRRTFAALREQRPSRLFIIADGARRGHPADAERCAAARAVVETIDWPCEVHRNYAESNLGLKRRVSSGLDWVFGQVERAIVLEDDCLAHPDFFTFCDTLLDRYADDGRVFVVTGNNFQDGQRRGEAAYYFSRYNHCWGWATWRRAWKFYRGELPFWPEWQRSEDWKRTLPDAVERRYWKAIFNRVHAGQVDSWAYPWTACVWHKGGLTATPNTNLVSNIGFGEDATHTRAGRDYAAALETQSIGALTHPDTIVQDLEADRFVFEHHFGGKSQRLPYSLLRLPGQVLRKLLGQPRARFRHG